MGQSIYDRLIYWIHVVPACYMTYICMYIAQVHVHHITQKRAKIKRIKEYSDRKHLQHLAWAFIECFSMIQSRSTTCEFYFLNGCSFLITFCISDILCRISL